MRPPVNKKMEGLTGRAAHHEKTGGKSNDKSGGGAVPGKGEEKDSPIKRNSQSHTISQWDVCGAERKSKILKRGRRRKRRNNRQSERRGKKVRADWSSRLVWT